MGAGDPASAPGSEGAKKTGKKDALGTSFAFVFFFKCIYKRSFPICSGKMFFKLRDKDFVFFFFKTNDDMKAFSKKNKR